MGGVDDRLPLGTPEHDDTQPVPGTAPIRRSQPSGDRRRGRGRPRPVIVDATLNGYQGTDDTLRNRVLQADGPSLRRGLRNMWSKLSHDRVLGMSAEAGFWGLLSLPSLLLAVFGALGYLAPVLGHAELTRVHDDVLRAARDVLSPQTVNDDVAPFVDQILGQGHAEVVSISFVISLWSGSSATSCYLNTITVAYGMRGLRSAVRSRMVALVLYLLSVFAGIIVLPALVLGPGFIDDLAPHAIRPEVSTTIRLAYWPVLVLALLFVLTTLYRVCLPRPVPWRHNLIGAVFAMLVWIGGSIAVRFYIAERLHSTTFDGALGAPIAALLFFYVTALGVLLGAELNAALRPAPSQDPA
jgi:membrane protein